MGNTKIIEQVYGYKNINKMVNRINLLGCQNRMDTIKFMNIRLWTSILIFIVLLYLTRWGYILAPIITFIYHYFLPKVVIDLRVVKRKRRLEYESMYFFEVLALALESGNNLYNALKITVENMNSELSFEFKKTIDEVDCGKSLNDALVDLKHRIPSDAINNTILNLKEANTFGGSVVDSLYSQEDYICDKIIMERKAEISKIPLKISIISVVFFIPLLLLLILGPILIDYFS